MSKYPIPTNPRQKSDLIAFIAVLATGTSLIIIGHATPTALATAATALTALYAGWKNRRPPNQ